MTYTSFDDRKTWQRSNNMDIGGHGDHSGTIEGTIEELHDGRLWILLRTYNGCFYESSSKDKGLTWTHPVPGKIKASGSPGILRRLASGRLVLLWNRFAKDRPRRLGRREELSMAFSNDDGTTWTPPVILLRLRSQRQSYPQVFERPPRRALGHHLARPLFHQAGGSRFRGKVTHPPPGSPEASNTPAQRESLGPGHAHPVPAR